MNMSVPSMSWGSRAVSLELILIAVGARKCLEGPQNPPIRIT